MLLTPWLNRVHQRLHNSKRRRRGPAESLPVPSAVERLEDRTLLAVTSMFSSMPGMGTLRVEITPGMTQDVTITRVGAEVRVNNVAVPDTFTGKNALADDVLGIDVEDLGGTANRIDLLGVTTTDYPNISKVVINAAGGNDTILGSAYGDSIRGEGGNDYISGGAGDDTIRPGLGDDTVSGGAGADDIDGQAGNDTLAGGAGSDTILGNGGDDKVFGDSDIDEFGFRTAAVADGDDCLDGGAGNDTLEGEGGHDKINGAGNDDSIEGGAGNDTLFGGAGNDTLNGGEGNDIHRGQGGNDSMNGGDGSDTFYSEAGNDLIDGGIDLGDPDIDHVIQEADADQILTDTLLTGNGTNVLSGIETAHLIGGKGKNLLDASKFTGGDPFANIPGEEAWLNPKIGKVTLEGGDGRDTLIGTIKKDKVIGRLGDFPETDPIFAEILKKGLLVDDPRIAHLFDDKLRLLNSTWVLVTSLELDMLRSGKFTVLEDNRNAAPPDDNKVLFKGVEYIVSDKTLDLLDWVGEPFVILCDNRSSIKPKDSVIIFDSTDKLVSIEEAEIIGGKGNNKIDASQFKRGPVTLVGGDGADTLIGTDFRDLVPVDPKLPGAQTTNLFKVGGDVLEGGRGNDIIDGRAGRDMLREFGDGNFIFRKNITTGDFELHGVNGKDILKSLETAYIEVTTTDPALGRIIDVEPFSEISETWLFGGAGADTIIGAHIADFIDGRGGDDHLNGGRGNDTIFGGAGNDRMFGGRGVDSMDGGEGNDYINGQGGDDNLSSNNGGTFNLPGKLLGGAGNDTILSGSGNDWVEGGDGNDLIDTSSPDGILDGNDSIWGDSADNDVDTGDDTIISGCGNDLIFGGGGNDSVLAGRGHDTVFGGAGNDAIFGGAGNDLLLGEAGNDSIQGGAGDDIIAGGQGKDTLSGGTGNDGISGGGGADVLSGDDGNDTLVGGGGADSMHGGAGDDLMLGEAGADTVNGGLGKDSATGGGNGVPVDPGDMLTDIEVVLPFIWTFDAPWVNL